MNLTSTRVLASLMVAAGLALTAAATDQTTTLFPAVDTFETDESWFDPNVGNVVNAAADMAATDYKNLRYSNTDEANQYGVKAWTADGTDESTLVSETYDYSAQPFPMGLTAGSMFLNLNTAGATLSRQLGDYDDSTHEFTAGASFESDPIWVDTMIKFVKSDETPTSIPADVKLAMWVDADNYLVIYSATMDDEGTILDPVATTTTIAIDADSWYRVTVETIAIDSSIFASRVWVNGVAVDGLVSDELWEGSAITGQVWFPSVDTTSPTLKYVSFKGTGAVDDLTVSYTEATFSDAPASFTLTIGFDSELLTVTAGEGAIADGATVNSGTAITVTANDWYQITAVEANATAVADGLADLSGRVTTTSFTAIANGADAAITIAANKYSDGTFGANNAPAGKAADWGLANSISTTDFDTYYNQYLLNVAPEASTAIEIKKVEMGDSAATITVEAAAGVDWSTINGALTISVSEDLANWVDLPADAEGITVTPDADNANQATITIALPEGNKYFVKALVK